VKVVAVDWVCLVRRTLEYTEVPTVLGRGTARDWAGACLALAAVGGAVVGAYGILQPVGQLGWTAMPVGPRC
jgi:hypothetical protein